MNEVAQETLSTKDRILDAAERLFAGNGIGGSSLRAITAEAGVNLAAVNYHFQSKEALIHAVIARRIDPINAARLRLLKQAEDTAGDSPVPIEQIIDAFVGPVIDVRAGEHSTMAPLMGRIFTEDRNFVEQLFQRHFASLAARFIQAIGRTLPRIPTDVLLMRLHFTVGVMAHFMVCGDLLSVISHGACNASDVPTVKRQMYAFLKGGWEAPVPEGAVNETSS